MCACVTGIQWGVSRDSLKHPSMHRTAPEKKKYPVPSAKGAEAEKHGLSISTS